MVRTAAPETLRAAQARDAAAVLALLESAGLPAAGVEAMLPRFVIAESAGQVVGVAGLELHGDDGLLRSVAVEPAQRGRGLGARLTERIVEEARGAGVRRLYLLTTTAEGYFPRLGFRRITRAQVSAAVLESVEFREACPASAVVMVLDLETKE